MPRPRLSDEERARRLRERQRRRRAAHATDALAATRVNNTERRRSARILANEARLAEARALAIAEHRLLRSRPTLRRSLGLARDLTYRPHLHSLGDMNQTCSSCVALHFCDEKRTPSHTSYNMCCNLGKVSLQPFRNFPTLLRHLLADNDRMSQNFRGSVRNYNSGLAMASMIAHVDTPIGGGPYCYRIHGQVYHRVGALRPPTGTAPQYAQIMIMDTEQAAAELAGRSVNRGCNTSLFADLHRLLLRVNPYAQSFIMMDEVLRAEEQSAIAHGLSPKPVHMVFGQQAGDDLRRYNPATANEVAVIYVGNEDDIPGERRLVIRDRGGSLRTVSHLYKQCDPLTYPLLFPTGEDGWHPRMEKHSSTDRGRTRVTQKNFYLTICSFLARAPLIHFFMLGSCSNSTLLTAG
ncbi:unnamed protein product [Heligmosomoides polygyrus]|uniref:Helitron_like_N domain-containing protein n=1 Tax=Heligmosomoides polygyrus TaxID=6339 RepID=A0A183G6L6_HELPZ|nr:unnamed protein product [Heligmosomoides polygyrus]